MVGVVGGDMFKLYRIASSVNGDDVFDDELGTRRLRRAKTLSWSVVVFFDREEPRSRLNWIVNIFVTFVCLEISIQVNSFGLTV